MIWAAFYPVVMASMLTLGTLLMQAGWKPGLAVMATHVTTLVLVLAAEAWRPARPDDHPRGLPGRADWGHLLLSNALTLAVGRALITGGLIATSQWLLLQGWRPGWPHQWPLALQCVAALLIGDLVQYLWHRTMHRVPLLWRFHAVHHSPRQLRGVSAAWGHPLEVASVVFAKEIPLVLLGAPPVVLAVVAIVFGCNGFLQHANLPLRTRWLDVVIATAANHRLHHEIEPVREVNFGSFTVLWDRVFGTRGRPDGTRVPTGIRQDLGARWIDHALAPWRWPRLPVQPPPAARPGSGR